MYKLIKQGNSYNDSVYQYICDTLSDLELIPLSKVISDNIGDKAYIIATSEKYVRDSEGNWQKDISEVIDDIAETVETVIKTDGGVQQAISDTAAEVIAEDFEPRLESVEKDVEELKVQMTNFNWSSF